MISKYTSSGQLCRCANVSVCAKQTVSNSLSLSLLISHHTYTHHTYTHQHPCPQKGNTNSSMHPSVLYTSTYTLYMHSVSSLHHHYMYKHESFFAASKTYAHMYLCTYTRKHVEMITDKNKLQILTH